MSRNVVVAGDDIVILQTLKRGGVPVDVSAATKIESRLVLVAGSALVTSVVEQVDSGGADWSTGLVEHVFPSAETADSPHSGPLILETQVTLGGRKTTWLSSGLSIVRGTIP